MTDNSSSDSSVDIYDDFDSAHEYFVEFKWSEWCKILENYKSASKRPGLRAGFSDMITRKIQKFGVKCWLTSKYINFKFTVISYCLKCVL